jgi:hypothetical protein
MKNHYRCFGRTPNRLCVALLQHTDQVIQGWHNQPPHRYLANRLNLLTTLELVATSEFFIVSVIRHPAALISHNLTNTKVRQKVHWAHFCFGETQHVENSACTTAKT